MVEPGPCQRPQFKPLPKAGDRDATWRLASVFGEQGHIDEAVAAIQRRADAGDQPPVVERGHLSTATDAELKVRIRGRVQLQRVAIGTDDHGLSGADQYRCRQILGSRKRE